jgi:hypothetical protein
MGNYSEMDSVQLIRYLNELDDDTIDLVNEVFRHFGTAAMAGILEAVMALRTGKVPGG